MKKIFIVAGELSGDSIGKWYKEKYIHKDTYCEGVGGDFLEQSGVVLYKRFELLNITGVVEVIKKLPFIFAFLRELVLYIGQHEFSEVVLIDFPGFNVRLAQRLKKHCPLIKITYVSPPQLWCWGQWRLKKLQQVCDDIVVMYPFEQAWYYHRGVSVRWLGSPVYDRLSPYFDLTVTPQKKIALLPASRPQELVNLFPFCAQFIKQLVARIEGVTFVLPLAESLTVAMVEQQLIRTGLQNYRDKIQIVQHADEKMKALATCCVALTKPGTITLELALLGIPTIMFFKTSKLNYFLAKCVVHVNFMALPNLLASKPLYKEFVQEECTVDAMVDEAIKIIESLGQRYGYYQESRKNLLTMRSLLKTH